MRWNTRSIVLVLMMMVAMGSMCFAQRTTATFGGVIEDTTHAVLPGAQILLVNEGTSATLEQLSNERGEFLFDFVPVGTYTLKMEMQGFKNLESRNITLGAAQTVRRTYTLKLGDVTDEVTVTGEAPQVNTVSPEQRMTLDTRQITNLPMFNRNITDIISAAGSGMVKSDYASASQGGTRYNMNGLGGAGMNATVDGGNASGYAGTQTLSVYGHFARIEVMSAESIGEVQVVKGVIAAEYPGMGGHVSMITRSGTNDWHGSLFHRYEGSVLNARQPLLRTKPNSVFNQYGGSLGGPIVRDKAFFFFAYEGYRYRTTVPINFVVPTPYFRDILRQSLPFKETDVMLRYLPLPNQPNGATDLAGRWIGAGHSIWNDDHVDAKVDYLVGGGNLSLTYAGGHPYKDEASSNPLVPVLFTSYLRRVNGAYVIGRGRLTSSTRVGTNWVPQQRKTAPWDEFDSTTPVKFGYRRTYPSMSYPGITLGGGGGNRGINRVPTWTAEQQFGLLSGTHSWKFGGRLFLQRGGADESSTASVSFQTLDDIRNNTPGLLSGTVGSSAVSWGRTIFHSKWSMPSFSFYAQDDWRIGRKLVLNLGLREDNFRTFVAQASSAPSHDGRPSSNIPMAAYNLDGLLDPVNFIWGPLRDPKKPWENDNWNFAPRFGFAYTADNQGNFVVRGGFAVSFAGFDGTKPEETGILRDPRFPPSKGWSRAEAEALGLKWPVYTDDLVPILLAENRAQPTLRYNPNLQSPYAMTYTLGIERALTPALVLETAFVGTRGVKFTLYRTYNQVDRVTGIRPNVNDQQGTYLDNSQQTNYNSWQTSLKQRLTRGLALNIHYTWSKSLSYAGGDLAGGFIGDGLRETTIEDFNNVKIERSSSSGDLTHVASVDFVYAVPTPFAASSVARHVLGGWNISGIWGGRTGVPLGGRNGITQTGGRPDLIDFEGAINKNCCSFGNQQYLNPAAFKLVEVPKASGRTIRRGNMNSNPLKGPGVWNLDLSMGKNFGLTEHTKIELKCDMLNALNHTQYVGFSTNLSSIDFGKVNFTALPRVIQVQLRLAF